MPIELVLLIASATMSFVMLVLVLILIVKRPRSGDSIRHELDETFSMLRMELNDAMRKNIGMMGDSLMSRMLETDKSIVSKLELQNQSLLSMNVQLENRFKTFAVENEQKLENIRSTVEKRLTYIQEDNNKRLDEVRKLVDDKLQERITKSFALVNERLEQVYRSLGEMQTLAVGVGDLKKVLSNVKTRGVLGEVQLGAILDEILAPEQFETNVVTVKGSRNAVEYAIKLPGASVDGECADDNIVYIPIDAKFPSDIYYELMEAYDSADPARVKAAQDTLRARIRGFAKDIRDKYVSPPRTTEFAIMFLPTEGLYAEAVKLGLIEALQHDYRISLTGPSTMAAFLNSLQMGFRSLALQKRSGEVWKILGAVRTEFDKFQDVLEKTQERLTRANNDLDLLIGVRTRQIKSKLREVTALPADEANLYLPSDSVISLSGEESSS